MPRANRYMLPGYTYHLTHRCHNRSFLLRFARDRTEYCRRLRLAVRQMRVSLLGYCVTSNHIHLLCRATDPETISQLMQKLEGEFAEFYNIRKRRSGAFWEGRYGCTMIDGGEHLWRCMKYIDLNMVRAGVVRHPEEWDWCGYGELIGIRQRYCLLDRGEVLRMHGGCDHKAFATNYRAAIAESIGHGELGREPMWTESIAVGGQGFVEGIRDRTLNRVELEIASAPAGGWALREAQTAYS
jgi:putative transposase